MEKYRVLKSAQENELRDWINKQAEEGYEPVLLAGAPSGTADGGTFCVIVEYKGNPKAQVQKHKVTTP